jgi:hypothetical protein
MTARVLLSGGSEWARPWNVDDVCAAFASAAVDPSLWNEAMEKVTAVTASFGAGLFPIHGRLPDVPRSESMAPSFDSYIRDGWVHRDERFRGVPTFARRSVFTEFDFTTPDEIARHPFYQEFLAPHGLRWVGAVKVAFGEDFWILSIQRSIAQGPFAPAELEWLAQLSQRLTAAGALARAFGFARAEAALAAFEVSRLAVALLDRCGKVIQLNSAAERLLGPDLQVVQGRLTSRTTRRRLRSSARSTFCCGPRPGAR